MKGMGAEGHPGITMNCCMTAALQRHDDILLNRSGIHSALCRMRDQAACTIALIGDVFLQSGIVKPVMNHK